MPMRIGCLGWILLHMYVLRFHTYLVLREEKARNRMKVNIGKEGKKKALSWKKII